MKKSENDYQTSPEELRTTVASISSNQIHEADSIANNMFTQVDIPEPYRIDVKPFVERPFYAGATKFTTTDVRYSVLPCYIQTLPGDVIRSNPSLLNAMKVGSLYRANLELNITLAGTITHAGKILAAVIPPLPPIPNALGGVELINHALSGPHGVLNANEATSITLPVPWYCNADLATLDMDTSVTPTLDITPVNGNYATLVLIVMNPLSPSSGSSQELAITIEAIFKNLDVVVPTPRYVKWFPQSFGKALSGLKNALLSPVKIFANDFIDTAANTAFSWIGLHNPNVPTMAERDIITTRNFPNTSDAPQFFEKLDPYTQYDRIMQSPIFGSDVDEMSTNLITNKKQYIGSFVVKATDQIGTLYWARPISPMQGGLKIIDSQLYCANNIELMHTLHRAWRGDLEISIESVMNNKQHVRLRVLKLYNPTIDVLSNVPEYQSIVNAPSSLLTYTAGGQEHVVSLPYLCRNDLTPCAEDLNFEGLFHGMYYIYLAQPLANSSDSPEAIEFNVYIRGTDSLAFYGYPVKNMTPATYGFQPPAISKFQPQSNRIKVMNESQSQDDKIGDDTKKDLATHAERLFKTSDLRSLIRRMYVAKSSEGITLQPNDTFTQIVPLSELLGESPMTPELIAHSTPITAISRMYYGKTVGFKFQLRQMDYKIASAVNSIETLIYYVPPNMTFDNTNTVIGASVNPNFTDPSLLPQWTTPLPIQTVPVTSQTNIKLYEFSVPDVTLYKFMGSPLKFYSVPPTTKPYSTSDFGSLYIRYTNVTPDSVVIRNDLMVGLTDETRFGFHTLASPFFIDKKLSPYADSDNPKASGMYVGSYLL